MKFADNLKNLRKSKKISQEQLAEKVGVSRQSVSKWETSEAYPEMNNILELCKIFHCNINDLVNDNMIDLDSLDEEVKMSVVKLKKEKQKQMKGISNILSIIGKIAGIVLRVALGFIIIAIILTPVAINSIDVKDGKLVSNNDKIKIVESENDYNVKVVNKTAVSDITDKDTKKIISAFENHSKLELIGLIEVGLIFISALIIILIKLLKHLELLFSNINKGDTPFTLDNVKHIKMMSYFMIASIILASICETIFTIAISRNAMLNIDLFDIIQILFVYSMSLVFEYGYEIQLDSKGKMYDEK